MTKEQLNFVKEYYDKLEESLEIYNKNTVFNDENDLFDTIFEIKNVFSKELPEIEDSVVFRSGSGSRDAQTVLGIMKKYLISNGYKEKSSKINDKLEKFCNSFKIYFETRLPSSKLLKDEYIHYDNWNGGTYHINIDYNHEYNLHYGQDYDDDMTNIENIKMFIEIAFSQWIKVESRYDFTKEVNLIFKNFKLPYKLQAGKVISQGYKTTNFSDKIVNYKMLERKIAYAEEMIFSKEPLDKKCALDYIIDSLQYIISIQDGKYIKDKFESASKTISNNFNSKIFSVINKEIDEIMKISNEYFDIRHNEYLNKQKEKREPITDIIFIEYLYNRAYSLLYILKLKYNYTE